MFTHATNNHICRTLVKTRNHKERWTEINVNCVGSWAWFYSNVLQFCDEWRKKTFVLRRINEVLVLTSLKLFFISMKYVSTPFQVRRWILFQWYNFLNRFLSIMHIFWSSKHASKIKTDNTCNIINNNIVNLSYSFN